MQNQTLPISALPKGTSLSRYLCAKAQSRGHLQNAAMIADGWRDSPSVALTLRAESQALMTTGTGSALAAYGVASEVLSLLRERSLLSRLSPLMRATPFRTIVTAEASGASAAWVSEGAAIPVVELSFSNVALANYKMAVIVVLSQELVKLANPAAESTVRGSFIRAVAAGLDAAFVNPALAATDANPASITNGATVHASTGSTAEQILADLTEMASMLGFWVTPRWLLSPATASTLAGKVTAGGGLTFPNITAQGGSLLGIPVETSANLPSTLVVLADLDSILLADGSIEIETTDEASLQMSSTPAEPAGSPITNVEMVSLWSRNLCGFKAVREIAWQRVDASAVVYMTVTY